MSVLRKILEVTEKRVERERKEIVPPKRRKRVLTFEDAFRDCCMLMAEFKRSSPSGVSAKWVDPKLYVNELFKVASAFSVLTEPHFFKGSYNYLADVSSVSSKPVLMKDFIIDPFQIKLGHAYGADAVLLIAKAMREEEVDYLARYANSLGLLPLIEVTTVEEVQTFSTKPYRRIIGVNSRDLDTLKIDINRLEIIRRYIKGFAIAESGIRTTKDAYLIGMWGYEGMLVGTTLMESEKPGKVAIELKRACCKGLREGQSSLAQR